MFYTLHILGEELDIDGSDTSAVSAVTSRMGGATDVQAARAAKSGVIGSEYSEMQTRKVPSKPIVEDQAAGKTEKRSTTSSSPLSMRNPSELSSAHDSQSSVSPKVGTPPVADKPVISSDAVREASGSRTVTSGSDAAESGPDVRSRLPVSPWLLVTPDHDHDGRTG